MAASENMLPAIKGKGFDVFVRPPFQWNRAV